MKLTITLESETARWARTEADRRNITISRLVRELLTESRQRQSRIQQAAQRFFSRPGIRLSGNSDVYPDRNSLYD